MYIYEMFKVNEIETVLCGHYKLFIDAFLDAVRGRDDYVIRRFGQEGNEPQLCIIEFKSGNEYIVIYRTLLK